MLSRLADALSELIPIIYSIRFWLSIFNLLFFGCLFCVLEFLSWCLVGKCLGELDLGLFPKAAIHCAWMLCGGTLGGGCCFGTGSGSEDDPIAPGENGQVCEDMADVARK